MIKLQSIFSLLGTIFTLLCFVPYIVTILQGKTKPNRATWWVWATNGTVLTLGNLAAGADYTILPIVCSVAAQWCVALLSIKHGEGGWNPLDRKCLMASGISFILWRILEYDLIAIILPLLVDVLAAIPTLKKSYLFPETEDLLTYILYTLGGLFTVFAIQEWSWKLSSFEIAITPIYIFLINGLIVLLLTRHKTKLIFSTAIRKS